MWILLGTRGDHAGNFLEKLEDHTWCMKFAAFNIHVPEDQSFQENFEHDTTDTVVLREMLPGSCMNLACVSHEK